MFFNSECEGWIIKENKYQTFHAVTYVAQTDLRHEKKAKLINDDDNDDDDDDRNVKY